MDISAVRIVRGVMVSVAVVSLSAGTPALAQSAVKAPVVRSGGPWTTEQLEEFFCRPIPHSARFYQDWEKGEVAEPYVMKGDINPSAEARKRAFGTAELNDDTRRQMCDGPQSFGRKLGEVLTEAKGELKAGCTTASTDPCLAQRQQLLTDACVGEAARSAPAGRAALVGEMLR